MDKLVQLGFIESAQTSMVNNRLAIEIIKNENASNILYAIVVVNGEDIADWNVIYIGHTRKSFKNRMSGYKQGKGNAVNNRIHNKIIEFLNQDKVVKIYCMTDHFNIRTNDLYIDIAAGLEYSLISYYKEYNKVNNHPNLQNIAGNENYIINNLINIDLLEDEEKKEENENYLEAKPINSEYINSFNYVLKPTYWNTSFMNIPIRFSEYFGEHQETVVLHIFENQSLIRTLSSSINRTANTNRNPRLYFKGDDGKWFQKWKHKNYSADASIEIGIQFKNTLIIKK